MSETITTTQILDFLAKANKISTYVNVTKEDGVYSITAHADWDGIDRFHDRSTSITEDGQVSWDNSEHSFQFMDEMLDELVKEEEEREMKRQKREELLSRLTDEEKELLGVK